MQCFFLSAGPLQQSNLFVSPALARPSSTHSFFACSSFAAFALLPLPSLVICGLRVRLWRRRNFLVEIAAARFCREAGARVTGNVSLSDLDLVHNHLDRRGREMVADGLPLSEARSSLVRSEDDGLPKRTSSSEPSQVRKQDQHQPHCEQRQTALGTTDGCSHAWQRSRVLPV